MGIGTRIRELRGRESRESFAQKLGIHSQSLYRYETEERGIDIELVKLLSNMLGVSANWLVFGVEPKMLADTSMNGLLEGKDKRIAELELKIAELEDDNSMLRSVIKSQESAIGMVTRSLDSWDKERIVEAQPKATIESHDGASKE